MTTQARNRTKKEDTYKVGTWNIRSIKNKERELMYEFNRANLDMLAITETKRKGCDIVNTEEGHVVIYSGVAEDERAAGGVACIINKRLTQEIQSYRCISERILEVKMKSVIKLFKNIIVVYGPNNDAEKKIKDNFWNTLNEVTERLGHGSRMILGDFNARVGIRDELNANVLGPFGENVRNDNGCRLLEYARFNNLVVTNTYFKHKMIHMYTREAITRSEKSIIDYVLIDKDNLRTVKDIRILRGAELYTDHYLLRLKSKIIKQSPMIKDKVMEYDKIRTYRLNETDVAKRYKDRLTNKWHALNKNSSVTKLWDYFRTVLINTTIETCGVYRKTQAKQTGWWTPDIKIEVQRKKQLWKQYLSNKNPENYNKYKMSRLRVKQLVRNEKSKMWDRFGEKIEEKSMGNQKLFYNAVKNIRKKQVKTTKIKSKVGEIITNTVETMHRWKEYFEELLGGIHTDENLVGNEYNNDSIETDITLEELKNTIRSMKNGKACGKDKVAIEMIKKMDEIGYSILNVIINTVWKEEIIPIEWKETLVVPIYKQGDKHVCDNYRGINLLNTIMKIIESILEKRIRNRIEHRMHDAQCGFRKGRSIQDHCFTIRELITKMKHQDRKLYLGFVDIQKAFDTVNRNKLWKIMDEFGIDHKLIRLARNIYTMNFCYVVSCGQLSDAFQNTNGLRQGGSLSPLLFILYMDGIVRECSARAKKLKIGYNNLTHVCISEGVFADDVVVFAGNMIDLKYNLEIWKTTISKYDLKMNMNKTKYMVIGENDNNEDMIVDGQKIENVLYYKYLGMKITSDGKIDMEIATRVDNTLKIYHATHNRFIKKAEISRKTKMKIFKAI